MPTFGFSAFLKLLSLNDRPQRSLIRSRLRPSEGGFDFHRSFRLRAHRLIVDSEPFAEIIASVDEITRAPEQRSAREALVSLDDWRANNPGDVLNYPPATFESPEALFKVHFEPNFGLQLDGRRTALHIWNNASPPLSARMAYGALSLFPDIYALNDNPPDDFGVLSLRDERLFRLSDAGDHGPMMSGVVRMLEDRFLEIMEELELPPPTRPEESPTP